MDDDTIFREIETKLLRKSEVNPLMVVKMQMLRQNRPLQFLTRKSKSFKISEVRLPQFNSTPIPQEDDKKQQSSSPSKMYQTIQFQHNWGGIKIKHKSYKSLSPKNMKFQRKSMERLADVQLQKLQKPKFKIDRTSILNKNNLFLVPFLKSRIKVIGSELTAPCVADIPISYKYPPPPMKAQTPEKTQIRKTLGLGTITHFHKKRQSVQSRGQISPW